MPDYQYRAGMRVIHDKLVRDRIPETIEADGCRAITHVLDGEAFHRALMAKLLEEATEAQAAPRPGIPAEVADVLEVLYIVADELGIDWDDVMKLADDRRRDRGGFRDRLFLEYVARPTERTASSSNWRHAAAMSAARAASESARPTRPRPSQTGATPTGRCR